MISLCTTAHGQTANHIVVDGQNSDWPSPYPFSDPNAKIQYAIANDSAVLYISVKSSDDVMKGKFSRAGFTLFIDTKNEQSKSLSLDFLVDSVKPAPTTPTPNDSLGDATEEAKNSSQMRQDSASPVPQHPPIALREVVVTGTEKYDGRYPFRQCPAGIAVAAAADEIGELIWEIAIPFTIFNKNNEDLFRKKISVGFVEYPLTPNDFEDIMKAAQVSPIKHASYAQKTESTGDARKNDNVREDTQKGNKTGGHGGNMKGEKTGSGGMAPAVMMNNEMQAIAGMGNGPGEVTIRSTQMDDIEDMSELMKSTEPNGEKWQRAATRNETWKSVRLERKK